MIARAGEDLDASDHLEIRNLYSRYAHLVDSGEAEAWAECFTPDGELTVPEKGIHVRGPEELADFARGYFQRARSVKRIRRHLFSNIYVAGSSDHADGSCYLTLVIGGVGESPPAVVTTGWYDDRLARIDGGWRYKSRVLNLDEP